MIVIGLTGSIGTGKSTVTQQFAQLGGATLDSDQVVHELLAPGGEAVAEVAMLFPAALAGNAIDRRRLGAEVFGQPEKLRRLEAVIHPLVRQAQDTFIRKAKEQGKEFVVLDIPLLFETGGEKRCDAVVVTTATPEIQRERVLARPNMTEEKLALILEAQMPDMEKRARADFVIDTSLGKEASLRAAEGILLQLKGK
jgi:dephospho-CoA kinase